MTVSARLATRPCDENACTRRLPPHRREGRLFAAGRQQGRAAQGIVAGFAGRRSGAIPPRWPRCTGGVVGCDCSGPRRAEAFLRSAQAGRQPGRRSGRTDRAGADLDRSAVASRHHCRPGAGDSGRHRRTAALSQRALHHRHAAAMARAAGDQRERYRCDQRNPLRRQRPSGGACRHNGKRRPAGAAVRRRRAV